MDTLSKILDTLKFNGVFYFAAHFNAPWSVQVPDYRRVARFHYATHGSSWIRIDGVREPILLQEGNLILIPHGTSHVICDNPDTPVMTLNDVMEAQGYEGEGVFEIDGGQGNHQARLVCGHFEFDDSFMHPLIADLPPFVLLNENAVAEFSWLKDMLHFLGHVAQSAQEGAHAIIKRLSEVIFIQAIRTWHHNADDRAGFVAALLDPQLARGMRTFHANFGDSWSVEKLANECCMSRTLFADRFKSYTNMSPMQYVTQWRMHNAQVMLTDGSMSIDQVAEKVGYDSIPSFSKAFKRLVGTTPGEYRRTATTAPQALAS